MVWAVVHSKMVVLLLLIYEYFLIVALILCGGLVFCYCFVMQCSYIHIAFL